MSITKLSLADKIIEGYVKIPPSLQEQTLTKVAIQVCQNADLKKVILCPSPCLASPTGNYLDDIINVWDKPMAEQSKAICDTLCIPDRLKPKLVLRIWQIALELFSWNKKHQEILSTNSETADQFLLLSDWTVDGRLDERKIAERLVQDVRIPAWERYQLSCLCCMKTHIISLWFKIPPELQKIIYRNSKYINIYAVGCRLIELWSFYLEKDTNSMFTFDDKFWKSGLYDAIAEGATTATVHCWEALSFHKRQEIIIDAALYAYKKSTKNNVKVSWMWSHIWPQRIKRKCNPMHYADILYFFYSHMSEEQKIIFFQKTTKIYIEIALYELPFCFKCFLQWPYQEFFLSIVSKSWVTLNKTHTEEIIFMLLYKFTNQNDFPAMENENLDYDYGSLLLEVLQQAPERHKRYFFKLKTMHGIRKLFAILVRKPSFVRRDAGIIQRILQHATLEEKELFMRSDGSNFCSFLIKCENWALVDLILAECLPNESRLHFKKLCLQSYFVEELCSDLLTRDDSKPFITFLNWAFSSQEEISEFMSKIFAKEQRNFVRYVKQKVDSVDKIVERCLPCEKDKKNFKDRWVLKHGMNVSCHFIVESKWDELVQFLKWCFPSEEVLEQFQKDLLVQKSTHICGRLMLKQEWEKIEIFFKRYKLPPKDIYLLKKDTIIKCFSDIYSRLNKEELVVVAACLRWGLTDKESVMDCEKAFKEVEWKSKASYFGEERDQVIQQRWDKLIEERLCSIEVGERDKEERINGASSSRKKYKKPKAN